MQFSKKNNYSKALERLNNNQKGKVTKKYPNVDALKTKDAELAEVMIYGEYLSMHKPKIYQVFIVDKKFSTLKTIVDKIPNDYGFLSSKKYNDYKHISTASSSTLSEVSFASFKQVLIRPKNEDGTFIGEDKVPETLFYILSMEFRAIGERTLVIVKYPPLVMETNKLHDYEPEATYITKWVSKKLKTDLTPIDLKKFYETIELSKEYQRSGFKTNGLRTNQRVIEASFGIDLTKNAQPREIYEEADSELQSEVADWIADELPKTFTNAQLNAVKSAISNMSFAERYFNLIHTRCKFGRGYLKYEKKKVKYHYTLSYEEDRFPLVRCRKQGWDAFEPAFSAIKKFIEET